MKDWQFYFIMAWLFMIMNELTGETLFLVISCFYFLLIFIQGLTDLFSSSRKRKRK